MMLSSKGSLGTCIPRGLLTFLHAAFTAHCSVAAGVPLRLCQAARQHLDSQGQEPPTPPQRSAGQAVACRRSAATRSAMAGAPGVR